MNNADWASRAPDDLAAEAQAEIIDADVGRALPVIDAWDCTCTPLLFATSLGAGASSGEWSAHHPSTCPYVNDDPEDER